MKALSVIELSQLYGMNRQSIYKRINKGDLSKNSDGKIDLSEAIRVFGEPSNKNNVTTLQSTTVQKETEVDMLKQQVDILKNSWNRHMKRNISKTAIRSEKIIKLKLCSYF
jgi:HAMP domain-containing protein